MPAATTGQDRQDVADFFACTPYQQAVQVDAYRDQAWSKDPDAVGTVLRIGAVMLAIAGDVSGIAEGVAALQALRL
jgi:hypothetical protein